MPTLDADMKPHIAGLRDITKKTHSLASRDDLVKALQFSSVTLRTHWLISS
jgi:hypothetical protein